MKTKNIILAAWLCIATGYAQAQQPETPQRATIFTQGDSIIIRKGSGDMRIKIYEDLPNDSKEKEVEVYEGVYLEQIDADKRTFLDALPFVPKKKRQNSYSPHTSGVYVGYSRIANDFLSFGSSPTANINISCSWEFGFNLLSFYHNFKKNPHWGINVGTSWGYRSYHLDGNRALLKANGKTYFAESDENTNYIGSRLRYFFFRIPLIAEWQQKVGRHAFFINAGPEFEIRHGIKSYSHIDGGKRQTLGKGMYLQPIGVNMLVQAGYGDIGVYMRYSANRMFQKDKGPKMSSYSFGLAWYW